jgi:hypothetical protein
MFEFLDVDHTVDLNLDLVPKNSAKKSRLASPAPVMNWCSNWLIKHDQAALLRRIRNLGIKKALLRMSTVDCAGEPIRQETGERLRRLFRDGICELESLFGRDLAAWK